MTDPLVSLAARVEADPYFLGWALALYAHSEELDDAAVAAQLGCSVEQLTLIRLCRTPRTDVQLFRQDVAVIANHYHLDQHTLARIVKRARVMEAVRGVPPGSGGMLMAARDRQDPPRPDPEVS